MLSIAQQMLQDSRTKIELLRMQIIKVGQARNGESEGADGTAAAHSRALAPPWRLALTLALLPGQTAKLITPPELRVAELQHHMKIEAAVVEGAKNVVKQLSGRKFQDRRIFAEVGNKLAKSRRWRRL